MAIEKRIRKNGISFKIIAYAGYCIDDNGKRKQKRISKTFHPPENMSVQKAYKKALLIEEKLQNHINTIRYVPNELTLFMGNVFKKLYEIKSKNHYSSGYN